MRTHDERVLVPGLGSLNADLARYVFAVIQADHEGQNEWPHTAEDEAAIALRMVELAGQLEIHAKLLRANGNEAEPRVIEGESGSIQRDDGATL
jgi:hypothetical protein